MKVEWQLKHFTELSTEELFELLYLRTAIFVVEQNCPYQEVDEKDKLSFHLMGMQQGKLIAVSRIVPAGVSYQEVSIGRLALNKAYRGSGIADELIRQTMACIEREFGKVPIRISAQQYLLSYYSRHGFQKVGAGYLEDNIPHQEMVYTVPTNS